MARERELYCIKAFVSARLKYLLGNNAGFMSSIPEQTHSFLIAPMSVETNNEDAIYCSDY